MAMRLTILACVCLYCLVQFIGGTSDLNLLKLEMVANHLTEEECHKLFEALHMKHFFLDHTLSGTELPGA